MSATINVHGDLAVKGSLVLDKDNVDFPLNPQPGTLVIKGMDLYAYLIIGGMQTWYPLVNVNKNNSHIHYQAVPSLDWTVTHNLGVADFWYQVQDELGNVVHPSGITKIDNNSYTVHFTNACIGSVITVATSNVITDKVKAASVDVAGAVLIDNTGIHVNGQLVAIASDVDNKILLETQRAQGVEAGLVASVTQLQANLPSKTSQLQNDSDFQSGAQVDAKVQAVVGLAPANLNTIVEIAAALNNDANAAANITNLVTTSNAAMDARVTALEAGGVGGGGGGMPAVFGNFAGGVAPIVGTVRYYPAKPINISKINAWVSTTSNSALVIDILKNGIVIDTITIPAGQMKVSVIPAIAHAVTVDDYLTVNITSGTGTDLTVRLDY